MLYKKKSFSVPATTGNATMCDSAGHSMPDTKGKCIRCGEPTGLMAFAGDGPPQWGAVYENTSKVNVPTWTEAQSGPRSQRSARD